MMDSTDLQEEWNKCQGFRCGIAKNRTKQGLANYALQTASAYHCYYKYSFIETQLCLFMYILSIIVFSLYWYNELIMMEGMT
jgi:hypothetical protein